MRRDTLISALENVSRAILTSRVNEAMEPFFRGRPAKDDKLEVSSVLSAYADFMRHVQSFGGPEKEVLRVLNLAVLAEAKFWNLLISRDNKALHQIVFKASSGIGVIKLFFPTLIELLRRESDDQELVLQTGDVKNIKEVNTKKLTFLIREAEAPTLTIPDFAAILGDIESLFDSILKIQGLERSDLIVGSLDSGSEKSLDVVGLAAAVEKLGSFLLEAWDRIRFARATKARASIKAAADGLSLLNDLKSAQEKGTVTPEEAEKLKRTIIKNVDDLFSKGVYTREMEERVPVTPSSIPYQRTKLITHYVANAEDAPEERRTITTLAQDTPGMFFTDEPEVDE